MASRGRQAHRAQQRNKKNPTTIDADIKLLKSSYAEINPSNIETFADFPLSHKTQQGLKESGFIKPTEIQREAIGFALQGHDLLGAAKTGSGKTLAFLVPILERLYCEKWSAIDGVGALIISPTRELAYQTFEALRLVGKRHDFSAGLIIGGKFLREEADRINRTNIIVCTPGRLLQHMDQTVNFGVDRLQILVLDECDKILDLGFETTMNAIISNLPEERQTILFSATQTKSVKDLARLSLRQPVYVSVHENSVHSTPAQLDQSYIVCELHEKVNLLWFFIKHHLKSKTLVFVQSCKQVRYLHEVFKRMRPGVTLLALHGAMQQLKRVAVYEQFCRKQHAVLLATDIASRGLDFPAVNWVVQLDCPEDANTYIHRVGRTARLEKDGESLLVLLPSEEDAMLEQLAEKKVPINSIRVNPKRIGSIQGKLESQLAADPELKEQAKRAFVSYLRSVFLMSNKKVFDVFKLKMEPFARSLGLALAPRVRFLDKKAKQAGQPDSSSAASATSPSTLDAVTQKRAVSNKTSASSVQAVSFDDSSSCLNFSVPEGLDDDLFRVKSRPANSDSANETSDEEADALIVNADKNKATKKKVLTKAALAKKLAKKNIKVNSKVVFGDDGEAIAPRKSASNEDAEDDMAGPVGGIDVVKAMERLRRADEEDKKAFRERIKRKHQEERIKRKEKLRAKRLKQTDAAGSDEEPQAVLESVERFNPDELPDPDSSDDEQGSIKLGDDGRTRRRPSTDDNNSPEGDAQSDSDGEQLDSSASGSASETEDRGSASDVDYTDNADYLHADEETALKLLGVS